jgi:hypothetical protein
MSLSLLHAPAGEPVSFEVFARGQARRPVTEIVMAIQYVETRRGAERIYRAERSIRNRQVVLSAAARRLDDFNRPRLVRAEATSQEIHP